MRARLPWEEDENMMVRAHYTAWGSRRLAQILNRTRKAVRVQAIKLGVQRPKAEVQARVRSDPHAETMVGAALRMWHGPVNRESPMRWAA